jgi:aromatic-ring opening dioxygenase LigAB LigA subunit
VYFLHKLLWELRRDPALAARFRADPDAVLAGYELDPVERAAIVNRDFRTLYDRGANPYLLYFCALQIGVSRADYYAQLRAGRTGGNS